MQCIAYYIKFSALGSLGCHMLTYGIIQPTLSHKKGLFLAITNNYRALTWNSGPDDKDLLAVAPYDLVWFVLLIERRSRHNQCFRHIFRSLLATPRMVNIHTLTSYYV